MSLRSRYRYGDDSAYSAARLHCGQILNPLPERDPVHTLTPKPLDYPVNVEYYNKMSSDFRLLWLSLTIKKHQQLQRWSQTCIERKEPKGCLQHNAGTIALGGQEFWKVNGQHLC